jgi:GGDEF domain-containing protein
LLASEDEFAICAQHITSEGLAALVRRLKAFLAEPHQIHGKEVVVSGSIDLHIAAEGETVGEVIRLADRAMHVAKASYPSKGRHTSRKSESERVRDQVGQ